MKTVKILIGVCFMSIWATTFVVAQDVVYVPTNPEVVDAMLKLAEVKKSDMVYDLGCGDGRIVIMAAKKYGAKGKGIDIDPERIREANENAAIAQVTDNVEFIEADLFKSDFSEATVVTLYLLNSLNLRLRPLLLEQLKPGTRIVSQTFHMGDWKPYKTAVVDDTNIYLWIVPK